MHCQTGLLRSWWMGLTLRPASSSLLRGPSEKYLPIPNREPPRHRVWQSCTPDRLCRCRFILRVHSCSMLGGGSPTGTMTATATPTPTPTPSVTGISPTSGPTAGGTSVTITGTGFTGATSVTFGSTAATSYTVNSATSITATSPADSAGTVDITVTTSEGTSATSSADQFTYAAVPAVTGISPASGPLLAAPR